MDTDRPRERLDCVQGPRPCPWVSCRHHLAVDVMRAGGLKRTFPGMGVDEIPETCSLDVADRGGTAREDVAAILNLTRERVRQIEERALATLERRHPILRLLLEEWAEHRGETARRSVGTEDEG